MSERGVKRPLIETEEQVTTNFGFMSRPIKNSENDRSSADFLLPSQPMKTVEDDHIFPECLLLSQPFKDGYSSGDSSRTVDKMCHLSIKNSVHHSADDVLLKESDARTILKKNHPSSDIKCEHVKYLTYTNYLPIEEEFISLEKSSVEDCLYHAFKFVSNTHKDEPVKVNGQTVKQICKNMRNNVKGFSWILDTDNSNFRGLSFEQFKLEKEKIRSSEKELSCEDDETLLSNWSSGIRDNRYLYRHFLNEVLSLIEDTYYKDSNDSTQFCETRPILDAETNPNVNEAHLQAASALYQQSETCLSVLNNRGKVDQCQLLKNCLEAADDLLPDGWKYLMDGRCKTYLPLVVQNPELTKGNKLIEDKYSKITVQPDGVFVKRHKRSIACNDDQSKKEAWRLVVEVYHHCEKVNAARSPVNNPGTTHDAASPTPAKRCRHRSHESVQNKVTISQSAELRSSGSTLQMEPSSTSETHIQMDQQPPIVLPKPVRIAVPIGSANLIACADFCEQLMEEIKASVPPQCRKPHCMDKIAGQHVLELFTMAYNNYQTKDTKHIYCTSLTSPRCAKSIGIFIVDEFVYFSRLIVEEQTLGYITTGKSLLEELPQLISKSTERRPQMCYGNFRFDLTCANHRKAFIIFLKEFVCC